MRISMRARPAGFRGRLRRAASLLLLRASLAGLALACGSAKVATPAAGAGQPKARAKTALAALADEYFREYLRFHPISATLLGYHEHDARMPDLSPEGRAAELATLSRLRARIERDVPENDLERNDRVTRALLLGQIDDAFALASCELELWTIDPLDGPQVSYLNLGELQTVNGEAAAQATVARWRAMPVALDQEVLNLRRGLGAGKTAVRSAVTRVVRQLDELLQKPDADWPLLAPARSATGLTPAAQERFRAELLRAVGEGIRPAFARYRALIAEEIAPRARDDAAVGLRNVPGGAACYAALVRVHTSLPLDPGEVHRRGVAELERIRGEMERLGPEALGVSSFTAIQQQLRASAPEAFFASRDEVEAAARAALARAEAALPRFLGHVPRTPCVVKRLEEHSEKDAPIAYYREPASDGSRPGTYYVNTYRPEARPRFEAEALAFHESIPGHHVQIALAQELTNLPEFRKYLGISVFVEGWGLYAERLADELGLYGSPLARLGRLSFEAWRAGRLVVDTGMHAMGWSRSRAVAFLTEQTLIAPQNIENEVDRYIVWPGQALAYKVGELEILRLRERVRNKLGASFDLRSFHDAVLGSGAVTLPVLAAELEARFALTPANE